MLWKLNYTAHIPCSTIWGHLVSTALKRAGSSGTGRRSGWRRKIA